VAEAGDSLSPLNISPGAARRRVTKAVRRTFHLAFILDDGHGGVAAFLLRSLIKNLSQWRNSRVLTLKGIKGSFVCALCQFVSFVVKILNTNTIPSLDLDRTRHI